MAISRFAALCNTPRPSPGPRRQLVTNRFSSKIYPFPYFLKDRSVFEIEIPHITKKRIPVPTARRPGGGSGGAWMGLREQDLQRSPPVASLPTFLAKEESRASGRNNTCAHFSRNEKAVSCDTAFVYSQSHSKTCWKVNQSLVRSSTISQAPSSSKRWLVPGRITSLDCSLIRRKF